MIDHSGDARWSCRFQQRWWAASCAWSLPAPTPQGGAYCVQMCGSCRGRLPCGFGLEDIRVFIDLPVWFSAVSKVGLNSALCLMLELPFHLTGNDCPHLVLTWAVKAGLTAVCGCLAPPSALGKEVCLAGWLWRELHTVG